MAKRKKTIPLVHDDVMFHGIAELRPVAGTAGLQMQCVPESVREALNEKAAKRMLAPDGAEIRFVAKSESVQITLSCPTGACELIAFWGGFQDVHRHPIGSQPTTIHLEYPERLRQLKPQFRNGGPFSTEVWRLTLRGVDKHASIIFHEIKGQGLRPPHAEELPGRTYLAYGTSVTDGFAATAMHLSYIAQTARRLDADFINMGMAGSAYCEPELADYLAGRDDWDIATFELAVNMIGGGFTVDQFRQRASYMINALAAADPSRPVACITFWPYTADLCDNLIGPHQSDIAAAYRQALREIVHQSPHANVHLIEGSDLLRDITGYTIDLMHPGDAGMTQIAENLAQCLGAL